MRNDDLVWNGTGENVAGGVDEPKEVVDRKRAVHAAEAEKSQRGEAGAQNDEIARLEARHQYWADP